MSKTVLVLTEKPKQAKAIGKLVDKFKRQQRGFSGQFFGHETVVFPLSGSVVEVDTDIFDQYERNDLSVLPFLPPENNFMSRRIANTSSIKKVQDDIKEKNKYWDTQLSICNAFSNMMKKFKYDFIVLATDPDYEGAALGYDFLAYHGLDDTPIYAMDISNLSANSLKKELELAMEKKDAYDWRTFRFIGSARADENACIGINETRLLRGHTGTYITFGTQQTRLLQRIVERTLEHDNFTKTKKYRLKVQTDFGEFVLQLPDEDADKITDKAFIDSICSIVKSNNVLTVSGYEEKKVRKRSPSWVDGSKMANMVAKLLVPKATVTDLMGDRSGLLQVMYEKEIMTYPRGESLGVMPLSQFKEQQDIARMLSLHYDAPRLNLRLMKKYLWREDDKPMVVKGKEVMVNHTPYTIASDDINPDTLTKDEKIVFDESAKIILSAFYPDNKQTKVTIDAKISGYTFRYVLTHDDDMGWKELYGTKKITTNLQEKYSIGDAIIITDVDVEEYEDEPKPLFTENSLHLMMKKYKIGAESTFASHINNILDKGKVKRGFTKVEKRKIRATERGIALIELLPPKAIDGLKEFDEQIIEPLLNKSIQKEIAFTRRNEIIRTVHKLVEASLLEGINNPSSRKGELIKKIKEGGQNNAGFAKPKPTSLLCPKCSSKVLKNGKGNYSCINRKFKIQPDKSFKDVGTCSFFMYGKFSNKFVSGVIQEDIILAVHNGESVVLEGKYKNSKGKDYTGDVGLTMDSESGYYVLDHLAWSKNKQEEKEK